MLARASLAVLAALAILAPAAPAKTLTPVSLYTRDGAQVLENDLRLGGRARGVIRFDLRKLERKVRRAELHLDIVAFSKVGPVVARAPGGDEMGRASLPGRGSRIAIDVTKFARRGRTLTVLLRRSGATSVARPRLVLRGSSSPASLPPITFSEPPEGAVAVGAAGDVACSPRTTGWNRGAGTWTDCRQALTADMLAAGSLDAVFALGDLQYPRGDLADFRAGYGATWGRFLAMTRPIVGNHEYEDSSGAAGYWDYFGAAAGNRGEGWYSLDLGAWHVVALNTNCEVVACTPGSAQEQWLRADLAANPGRCTLAIMHHPRFTSGPNENGLAGFPEIAPLWDALHQAGVEVALAAHMHNYERFPAMDSAGNRTATGIASFVVGTGGRNLAEVFDRHAESEAYSARAFGYLRLVLRPGGYDWQFVAEPRSFTDQGSANCH
jgi:hypothetical protein